MNTIEYRLVDPNFNPLHFEDTGDWVDLCAAENVHLKPMENKLISLGISMKLPAGYEAHLLPRSSTYKKYGIIMANNMGIIDNSYCGNDDIWKFNAIALRETTIKKGDRIAQFRIVQNMKNEQKGELTFKQIRRLSNNNRGGFGSTDIPNPTNTNSTYEVKTPKADTVIQDDVSEVNADAHVTPTTDKQSAPKPSSSIQSNIEEVSQDQNTKPTAAIDEKSQQSQKKNQNFQKSNK